MLGLAMLGLVAVLSFPAFGDEGIPNLVGNWTLQYTEGIVFGNEEHWDIDNPGNVTWFPNETIPSRPLLSISEQKGREILGTYTIANTTNGGELSIEPLIGIVALDNKSIYMLHGDTSKEGLLVSPTEIELISYDSDNEGLSLFASIYSKSK